MTEVPSANPSSPRPVFRRGFLVALALILVLVIVALVLVRARGGPEAGNQTNRSVSEARRLLEGTKGTRATFFRVSPVPGGEGSNLRNYRILQQKTLEVKTTDEIRALLTDPETYSEMGAKCFEPGMGFRFSRGGSDLDLVICLQCSWIYAYEGSEFKSWALGQSGVAALLKVYQAHSDESKR